MFPDFTNETDEERQALLLWIDCWRQLMGRRHEREMPPDPNMPDPWYGRELTPEEISA